MVFFLIMLLIGIVALPFAYIKQIDKERMEEQERIEKIEKEILQKAAQKYKLKAEQEAARKKAMEEARRKAEEEARRKAEEEARRKAEEEARRKAEEEARHKAEEARRKGEEEARRMAEEEARRKAEEEAHRKAKEKARRIAEEEARRKTEEEKRIARIKQFENDFRISEAYKESAQASKISILTRSKDHRQQHNADYRCEDGHYVRSKAEREIDNFLYNHRIFHVYEEKYYIPNQPNKYYEVDFYIPEQKLYIEYFGMNTDKYLKNRDEKIKTYRADPNINFEYLTYEDDAILSDKLTEILKKHSIL